MEFRSALFTIDDLGVSLAGFTQGKTWNGWACPAFTREQADIVVDTMRQRWGDTVGDIGFDAATDTYRFVMDADDPEAVDGFPGIDAGDLHLYLIGAQCWCWMEDEAV